MTTIVTRAGKGTSLSWEEGDANFTNLNNDKIEASDLIASNITNTPNGNILATDVQTALNELDTEKVPLDGTGAIGTWPISITGNSATATNATNLSSAGASTVSTGGAVTAQYYDNGNVNFGGNRAVNALRRVEAQNYDPGAGASVLAEVRSNAGAVYMQKSSLAGGGFGGLFSSGGPMYIRSTEPADSLYIGTNNTDALVMSSQGEVRIVRPQAFGYGSGAGGTVTQATSKSTDVTLNTPTGTITTHNASLAAAGAIAFNLYNDKITSDSVVYANTTNATTAASKYMTSTAVHSGGGGVRIRIENIFGSSLSEAIPISFAVINGASS